MCVKKKSPVKEKKGCFICKSSENGEAFDCPDYVENDLDSIFGYKVYIIFPLNLI